MDESNKSLKARIEESLESERELKNNIKDLMRKIDDLETKVGKTFKENIVVFLFVFIRS